VLGAAAPHVCILELLEQGLVDLVAKPFNGGLAAVQHHRLVEVRQLALGFSVHPVMTAAAGAAAAAAEAVAAEALAV
jgi:hypothetical protein